jgi:hypothetical protein
VTGLNVKVSVFVLGLFVFIACILGWFSKLKKKSVQKYFYERCAGGPKSSDFWPTIKPFFFI